MKWIRWILVLPCAIFAIMMIYPCIIFSTTHIPIPYIGYVTEFIAGHVAAFGFVMAGSYVAPSHKRITALVLCLLFAAYSVYALLDPYLLYTDYGLVEAIIYKIGGMGGAIAAFFMTYED